MKIGLFWRILPVHILVCALLALPLYQRHLSIVRAEKAIADISSNSQSNSHKHISGLPVRIIAPTLGVDLNIVKGSYRDDTKAWTVASDSANYATSTVKNNDNKGTTLIYGHATSMVFAKTKKLKPGDKIFIKTDNGYVFVYRYKSFKNLNPEDTYLFNQLETPKPGLALMTCDGIFSQERRVMYFDLEYIK